MVLAALLTTAVAIFAAAWVARRRRDEDLREHGSPLLVMPGAALSGPNPVGGGPIAAFDVTRAPRELHGVPSADVVRQYSGPVTAIEDPVTATTGRFTPGSVAPDVVYGHSLRFHRPAEGTLAFLPGSLEVVGGPDAGHEVRFVRPANGDSPDITFGRKEGPPYRHIQLLEPTVSRTHARLSPEGVRWRLTNLSRTNPVVVNGVPLEGVNASQLLQDQDLLEMGALVFRFRAG